MPKVQPKKSRENEERVRANTAPSVNQQIDQEIKERVHDYADKSKAAIEARLEELHMEWDIERVLQMNASLLAFSGLILGRLFNRRWFWIPTFVLPFLFQHAVQGWCPPVPLLRRLGVRTKAEIDREIYSLKALRGDFKSVSSATGPASRAEAALKATRNS